MALDRTSHTSLLQIKSQVLEQVLVSTSPEEYASLKQEMKKKIK